MNARLVYLVVVVVIIIILCVLSLSHMADRLGTPYLQKTLNQVSTTFNLPLHVTVILTLCDSIAIMMYTCTDCTVHVLTVCQIVLYTIHSLCIMFSVSYIVQKLQCFNISCFNVMTYLQLEHFIFNLPQTRTYNTSQYIHLFQSPPI